MTDGRRPVALTIAGSDSGGGAGIAADLKTFAACGVWGTVAVTAVTAQNTVGVQRIEPLPADIVRAQIESVVTDIGVDAAKTGMLATAEVVLAVATIVRERSITPLVVDPVLSSSQGAALLPRAALTVLGHELLPVATLVTPNLAEAAALAGLDPGEVADRRGVEEAGRRVLALGPGAVLVTGGHLGSSAQPQSPDCLLLPDAEPLWLEAERVATGDLHGTGCVLSAAITAELARGTALDRKSVV